MNGLCASSSPIVYLPTVCEFAAVSSASFLNASFFGSTVRANLTLSMSSLSYLPWIRQEPTFHACTRGHCKQQYPMAALRVLHWGICASQQQCPRRICHSQRWRAYRWGCTGEHAICTQKNPTYPVNTAFWPVDLSWTKNAVESCVWHGVEWQLRYLSSTMLHFI